MRDTVATYGVVGMTCESCIAAVKKQVSAVSGVTWVEVELVVDGTSRVTVRSNNPLEDDTVRAALDGAGYALAKSHA